MYIVLIGMAGSGKSTVGRLLSEKLNRKFIETDTMIEKEVKLTIAQTVEKFGWDKFRDFESQVVEELKNEKEAIISTGGGIVIREENIIKLKKHGIFIWLSAEIETLAKRIGHGRSRPLFAESPDLKKEIARILSGRINLYKKAGDCRIDTDKLTPNQITEEIMKYCKRKNIYD